VLTALAAENYWLDFPGYAVLQRHLQAYLDWRRQMEPIPKSGYYYANKIVLITLKALGGCDGQKWIECYPKPGPSATANR
jgi:hypothetical protein